MTAATFDAKQLFTSTKPSARTAALRQGRADAWRFAAHVWAVGAREDIREGVGEASAGVRAGQPLSRDRKPFPGVDAVCVAEGNTSECAIASARATRRGRRTWHARTLLAREPGD